MAIFDKQIRAVKKLIAKYGQEVTLISTSATIPDPSKPWEQTDSKVELKVMMIFLPPSVTGASLLGKELVEYIKGSELKVSELRAYMAPISIIPKVSDIVVRDGVELRIRALDTLNPNGQIIYHTLEFES